MSLLQEVNYRGESVDGPSRELWSDCLWDAMRLDPSKGMAVYEPFDNNGVENLKVVEGDSGSTVLTSTGADYGQMVLTSDGTDNEEVYMALHEGGGICQIVKDSGKKLWWETRFQIVSIAGVSYIVGLINGAEIATNLLADDQLDANILDTSAPNFIGFLTAGDTDADALDAVYMSAGTSGAHIVHKNIAHTLVASTMVKVGLTFDGKNTIRHWVNDVKVGDALLADAAEVPDAVSLIPGYGVKIAGGAATAMAVDWSRLAYER